MPRRAAAAVAGAFLLLAGGASVAYAQQSNPEDDTISTIRKQPAISTGDQGRIARWVKAEVGLFSSFSSLRKRFSDQLEHADNSAQFQSQLCMQTAGVATAEFAKSDLNHDVAHALAQILLDMNRVETLPGLLAGLKSSDPRARYLCARSIVALRREIMSDQSRFDQVVQRVREVGPTETSPAILGRLYDALSARNRISEVFGTFLRLFDARLALRRAGGHAADAAELPALEFFRTPQVSAALSADQKTQLAARIAVFLRLDAERFNGRNLEFYEIDLLQRRMDGEEEILAVLVGAGKGGKIRDALSANGQGNRAAVLQQAYLWVGHPGTKAPGALNESPWNIPVGAP